MSDWIYLDMLALAHSREQIQDDQARSLVHVVMSPHDVPVAVRGRKEPRKDRFIIEFRYLDDESTREVPLPDGAIANIGKHSERLYGISFPHLKGNIVLQIEAKFDHSVEQLLKSRVITSDETTSRNLKAAQHAVDLSLDQLSPSVL